VKAKALMTARIEKLLRQALLEDGEMSRGLYQYEMEELLDEWKSSMRQDQDDFLFAITESSGHVAMVLIEQAGQVHVNEKARERLQALWPAAYERNMKKLIPAFAEQLAEGEIPVSGVKVVDTSGTSRA
jgi:hypothetical protein